MPYGLTDTELFKLTNVFSNIPHIEQVILYGSRAKGTFKPFSDIDLTLVGKELSKRELNLVKLAVDDLLLPYQFDISLFHTLKNKDLIEHIQRVGIDIYSSSMNKNLRD